MLSRSSLTELLVMNARRLEVGISNARRAGAGQRPSSLLPGWFNTSVGARSSSDAFGAICGIESRRKRAMYSSLPGRQGPKKRRMDNSEKDRLATTVVDLWCSFQETLAGTKRK